MPVLVMSVPIAMLIVMMVPVKVCPLNVDDVGVSTAVHVLPNKWERRIQPLRRQGQPPLLLSFPG